MSRIWLIALALWSLLPALVTDDVRLVVEKWDDGSRRVEREVVTGEDGVERNHGSYKAWNPGGVLLAEGAFEIGRESGEWKHYHDNGQLESTGRYKEGVRVGPWTLFHPDGTKAGEGGYRRGFKNGRWKLWGEDGKLDRAESGTYEPSFESWPDGSPKTAYGKKGKHRHGRYRAWDEAGFLTETGEYWRNRKSGSWREYWAGTNRVRLAGEYKRDERIGLWTFHHREGTADADMQSVVYEKGKESASPPAAHADWPSAEPIDLKRLPAARVSIPLDEERTAKLKSIVDALLEAGQLNDADAAGLLSHGMHIVAELLTRLTALDLSQPDDVARGAFIESELLARIYNGHRFGWGDDVRANQLSILRWDSLWQLTRDDGGFRLSLAQPAGSVPSPRLLAPYSAGSAVVTPSNEGDADRPVPVSSIGAKDRARLARKYKSEDSAKIVERAHAWLVAHQAADGRWGGTSYVRQCPELDRCDGLGEPDHDVGITGLCLLSLLAEGNTRVAGEHAEAVRKATLWLQDQADAKTGRIGAVTGHWYMYSHAIATQALAEAYRSGDASVYDVVANAVEFCLSGQAEKGGWRYDVPSQGKSDTSMTAWVVAALYSARSAGFEVPQDAFDGALAWIEKVSDLATGRIGYDAKGSFSARISGVNDDYSPEDEEGMTGAGLLVRILLSHDFEKPSVFETHADLIKTKPPVVNAGRIYPYGWFWCTQSMFQIGGKDWEKWNALYTELAAELQITDERSHGFGSWHAKGPWGHSGGRVCTTALFALGLQTCYRYPRLLK